MNNPLIVDYIYQVANDAKHELRTQMSVIVATYHASGKRADLLPALPILFSRNPALFLAINSFEDEKTWN